MTPVARTVVLCVLLGAVAVGALVYTTVRTPTLSADELREQGVFVLPRPRELTPFELTTHTGEAFTNADLEGRWSMLFFGFTHCPDICPTTLSVLGQTQRQLEETDPELAAQFQGVLVTVDPERDDAATLAEYVQAFSPDFLGVRGDRAATAALATQLNVAFAKVPSDDAAYQVDHTANVVIINPRGHYHGFAKMPHRVDTMVATVTSLAQGM